jgi:uncharacterized Zn-binding protein involved in type VI secretion
VGFPLVQGDQVTAQCAIHVIPNPATGAPQPSPSPLPFAAPLTVALATSVTIGGKPAAIVGSQGYNSPPHVGLHPSDPFFVPTLQQTVVTSGAMDVLIEGQPAATDQSMATCCGVPGGTPMPTTTSVMIG